MPFGPKNAPSHFQCPMHRIFEQLCPDYVTVFLDDTSVTSDTIEDYMKHLTKVFAILEKYGMRIRADKCIWLDNKQNF